LIRDFSERLAGSAVSGGSEDDRVSPIRVVRRSDSTQGANYGSCLDEGSYTSN